MCYEVTAVTPTGRAARMPTPGVKGTGTHCTFPVGGSPCAYKVTKADSAMRAALSKGQGPGDGAVEEQTWVQIQSTHMKSQAGGWRQKQYTCHMNWLPASFRISERPSLAQRHKGDRGIGHLSLSLASMAIGKCVCTHTSKVRKLHAFPVSGLGVGGQFS